MHRVLLAEDDQRLAQSLTRLMQAEGWTVNCAHTVQELMSVAGDAHSVLVLDRLLGGEDTKVHFQNLRRIHRHTPILILSAINTPLERAELINMGADDYVGKPFSSEELLARVRRLTNKRPESAGTYRVLGNTLFELLKRTIAVDRSFEQLPAKEFLLFKTLSENPGRVFRRTELLDMVWGHDLEIESNVVESTLKNLRSRLERIGSSVTIRNARNTGYWVEV